jgi:uncharacterized membrane protein
MVSSHRENHQLTIVARPNQSADWRTNKLVVLLLAIPCLGSGLFFTALGAWPVLPLAGLEISALGGALYYVCWKLQYRQVITLNDEAVRIDKGYYAPRRSWQFNRSHTGLSVTPEHHPWEGPNLCLHDRQHRVCVGEFLNRSEALELLALLKAEITVRGHGHTAQRQM